LDFLKGKTCQVYYAPFAVRLSPREDDSDDKLYKFNKYLEAGVREYWMVDPDTNAVQACVLENGRYILSSYGEDDTAPVSALSGCVVDLRTVFGE
jgi:Uma2 family endonuclease